ncbi:MAG: ABC transporter ATP-binding protein [Oscillatoriophycideae cyanobacterium NC_groundwater_1537_Pr4_S-0.65um_50_18]|nr:ABC transporter ATP-binding protein [Oscillatoriophycideae cyanobacterium NC_groundwater_1537_Pr4_S-0.65um_50_18]
MGIIEADRLCYTYPKAARPVLQNLCFSIAPGTVTALLGCSGSGKSTLLLALAGIIPEFYGGDWSGRLQVYQAVVTAEEPQSAEVIEQVAIVLQVPDTQLVGFRVEETIAFGLENQGMPPVQIRDRIQQVLEELGIAPLRHRLTEALSGGQKQACVLAAMLALDTPVIVLDEPTAALDPAGKALVSGIIDRLKQLGKTLVISDQSLDWFAPLVDQTLVLDRSGSLMFSGALSDFLGDRDLVLQSGVPIPPLTAVAYELQRLGHRVQPWVTLAEARPWLSQQISQTSAQRSLTSVRSGADGSDSSDSFNSSDSVVHCTDLTYTYPGANTPAIAEVSFTANAGRILGIIGQNGSGKSTAIRHLNGLLKPQRGTVAIAGQSVARSTVAQMAKLVGIAFQNPDLMLFNETVEQEVFFSFNLSANQAKNKQRKDQSQDQAELTQQRTQMLALLEQFNLSQHLQRSPLALSVGEKQLLAILCAMALNPAVLVLDEPTFGMDRSGRQQLGRLLRQLQQQGKAVICIAHDLPLLAEFADDILVFQSGRVVCTRPTRDLFADVELFDHLGIPLPLDIQLALEFLGFPCLTPAEFADHFRAATV